MRLWPGCGFSSGGVILSRLEDARVLVKEKEHTRASARLLTHCDGHEVWVGMGKGRGGEVSEGDWKLRVSEEALHVGKVQAEGNGDILHREV